MIESKKRLLDRHVFFDLLRSGLWEQPVRLLHYEEVDFNLIFRLADEQSVVGLVASGLEHIEGRGVTKQQALPFMKRVFSMEGRNAEMNRFIAELFATLKGQGIQALLVKGQGIAQCYERPQWRTAGDVDLLLDAENYEKAKSFLIPIASHVEKEYKDRLHLGMTIDSWTVELHGSMRNYRLGRVNKCIDEAQFNIFQKAKNRFWINTNTTIELPSYDDDVIIVFTHILQHFFSTGIGLRQICDWCRLLWTGRGSIDYKLLASRLNEVRLQSEWSVFASLAVKYLGMPEDAMPFYRQSAFLEWKADRLMAFILRTGNFGHKQDCSYQKKNSYLIRKIISFKKNTQNAMFRVIVFPCDSIAFYFRDVVCSLRAVGK
jgi:hypothetical protein